MGKKLVCPFCYHAFDKDYIQYRCENPSKSQCKEENDPLLARYYQVSNKLAPHLIDLEKAKMKRGDKSKGPRFLCDRCQYPSTRKNCPQCHNELPALIHRNDTHVISVIGARESGKTHFITVLIHELLRHGALLNLLVQPKNVGVDKPEHTSVRYEREYWKPLYEMGRELPLTQESMPDHYPLIYQVISESSSPFKVKSIFLAFYDTAGENFANSDKISKYISNSSGIIFLLDTFQIPKVAKTLKSRGVRVPSLNSSFYQVYYQVRELMEREGMIRGRKSRVKIPMAVTFSKMDAIFKEGLFENLILDAGLLQENSGFLKTRKFSRSEVQRVSGQIKYQLEDWNEDGFLKEMAGTFKNLNYFGVSALGDSPKNGRAPEEINPIRVLDPLIWILDQINFAIPITK